MNLLIIFVCGGLAYALLYILIKVWNEKVERDRQFAEIRARAEQRAEEKRKEEAKKALNEKLNNHGLKTLALTKPVTKPAPLFQEVPKNRVIIPDVSPVNTGKLSRVELEAMFGNSDMVVDIPVDAADLDFLPSANADLGIEVGYVSDSDFDREISGYKNTSPIDIIIGDVEIEEHDNGKSPKDYNSKFDSKFDNWH